MADISVIIVTWNSEDEIIPCIESVTGNSKNLSAELIIIDNNSADNTFSLINKTIHPKLQTYKNETNLGYTKAVNQGISYSNGKNILLLNPDAVLAAGVLESMNDFLNTNENYGACAPLMLGEDGSPQRSVRNFPSYWTMFCEFSLLAYIFPKSKLFGRWKMKYFDYSHNADVEQPMAAALMIKKSVLNEIGNMDERFEMFFNDVDLCKKIIDDGYKIRLLTAATVVHKHGASVQKDRVRMIKTWNRDCIKYFEKYHSNALGLLRLKINLKISEILRILYHKITGKS
jgi:GT2 family glycosyltransferase